MTKPFLKRFYENTKIFLPLGYTSFGGPNAHIGILHNLLVEKHGWLNDQTFSELYSICQALPGPSSTQLAYSLGVVHDGFLIGIWDFLLWSIPMGVVMALIGLVVARQSTLDPDHEFPLVVIYLTQGLASAAIGLIVLAAYKLHLANAIDSITKIIVFLTASIAILYSAPWLYPILMLASGCFTLFYYLCREKQEPSITSTEHQEENNDQGRIRLPITDEEEGQNGEDTLIQYPITFSGIFFTIWLVLFILAILARFLLLPSATTKEATPLSILSVFYFVGSIIFGGGPVVIPLLQGYTQDWVTSSQFVLGLAIQNSLPGPNFNFATYLGAIALSSNPIGSNVLGALLGFIGIFLPGILLQSAVIPCWQYVRSNQKVKLIFRGVNAAATGLVFSTIWILWNQINQERHNSSESLHFVIAVMTFVLSEQFHVSTPLVVILGGLIGLLEWFLSVYL
ncbi:chromate transporter-domain-containing protein [Cunninghamella echinulata]|nr:chromate transporter-domain-containing protein [Cunninghamella echinulata]